MKKIRLSDNAKRVLWVLNILCLVGLAFSFLSLVDLYFMQDSGGGLQVADYGTTIQNEANQNTGISVDEQFDVFAKQVEVWSNNGDFEISFTVADMNLDGQWELITDSIQGTGHFAYNQYYVVGENETLEVLEDEERFGLYLSSYYPSENGVIVVPVYYDMASGRYCSIQGVGVRELPTIFRYSLYGLWIENGEVEKDYLGTTILEQEDAGGERIATYKDADGNVITEEEFNNLATKKYSQLEKMQMTWKWQKVSLEELTSMSGEEVKTLLLDSYENFNMQNLPAE